MRTKYYSLLSFISLLFFLFMLSFKAYSSDYTINFGATGDSNLLDSIVVQNLTQGKSVTVMGGNSLILTNTVTAIPYLMSSSNGLRVYSNALQGQTTLKFNVLHEGYVNVNVFGMDGKKVAGITQYLKQADYSIKLILDKGIFAINVSGMEFSYSAKVMSQCNTGICNFEESFSLENSTAKSKSKIKSKTDTFQYLQFSDGDQLIYKGYAGNYCTIQPDSPNGSKDQYFVMDGCFDADNNSYAVVTIGNQTWMAENLKTTKYANGDAIPKIADTSSSNVWGELSSGAYSNYIDFSNNVYTKYGNLYNWYVIDDVRKIAPIGWHIATVAEFTDLTTYLRVNGYNFNGLSYGNLSGKSLSGNTDWYASNSVGAVGNDLSKNNSTGFNALPGGTIYLNGAYQGILQSAAWWLLGETTFFNAQCFYINYANYIDNTGYDNKKSGFYVRCVKD